MIDGMIGRFKTGEQSRTADLSVEQCEQEVELTFNTAWSPQSNL